MQFCSKGQKRNETTSSGVPVTHKGGLGCNGKKIAQCKADDWAVVGLVGAMVGAMVGNGVQLDPEQQWTTRKMKRRLMGQYR